MPFDLIHSLAGTGIGQRGKNLSSSTRINKILYPAGGLLFLTTRLGSDLTSIPSARFGSNWLAIAAAAADKIARLAGLGIESEFMSRVD